MNLRKIYHVLSLLMVVLLIPACVHSRPVATIEEAQAANREGLLLEIEADFVETLRKEGTKQPVLVELTADWCGACQSIKKRIERLAAKGKGRYLVASLDVSGREEIMVQFGVKALPAFFLYLPGEPRELKAVGSDVMPALEKILKENARAPAPFPMRKDPLPNGIKAVIVAGSSDAANFTEEIYLQYIWLKERGLKIEEIACFYARPNTLQYYQDQAQFERFREFYGLCKLAEKADVLTAVAQGLKEQPDAFYLYISTHGNKPESVKIPGQQAPGAEKAESQDSGDFTLVLDSRDKAKASADGWLTPEDLAQEFSKAPQTKKIVVLQACYSGGFISAQNEPQTHPSPLAQLPAMTLLTASRADRVSFGCETGAMLTEYGHSFLKVAVEEKAKISEIDWQALAAKVAEDINAKESRGRFSQDQRSLPQFFQKP